MRYESAKTEKGNIGVSYDSQEAADLQAKQMDENGNRNSYDCHGCTGCRYCTGCRDCAGCTGCTGCTYCTGCTGCRDCRDCRDCAGCTDTQGALRWSGEPAKALLSINGLRWPVSTDGKSIQIGCQHHSVDEWRAFDDRVIAGMDSAALEFWKRHKEMILSLAEVRKNMEGKL